MGRVVNGNGRGPAPRSAVTARLLAASVLVALSAASGAAAQQQPSGQNPATPPQPPTQADTAPPAQTGTAGQAPPAPEEEQTAGQAPAAQEEEEQESSVLLLMDSSGSMAGDDGAGTKKIDAAKDAVNGLLDSLPGDATVGLRVFGGQASNEDKAEGCQDTRLIFPAGKVDPEAMKERVESYRPMGFTPIALSLRKAATDLPEQGRRTIVLVSDGEDTCQPPSPCAVAGKVARQGIDIRIEAIGFRVNAAARRELQCIARAGGGSYRDAGDAEELSQELRAVSTRAVRSYRPEGEPISGGPSIRAATETAPGQYLDSMQPGTTKWYAVSLARGETLTAAATVVPPPRKDTGGIGATFSLRMYNSHFELQTEQTAPNLFVEEEQGIAESVGVFGLPAGFPGDSTPEFARSNEYGDPGPYYLEVELADNGEKELRDEANGRPFGVELLVDVLGRDSAARLPVSIGPDGEGTAVPSSTSAESGAGLGSPLLALIAGALLMVGIAAGGALAASRRTR